MEDKESGCTAIRVPLRHVNHLVTSNLPPPINQCLLWKKVHIWKLAYYCPALLQDVLWRPGSDPKLSDFFLTPLSERASIDEEVFQTPECAVSPWCWDIVHLGYLPAPCHPYHAEGLIRVGNWVCFRAGSVFCQTCHQDWQSDLTI